MQIDITVIEDDINEFKQLSHSLNTWSSMRNLPIKITSYSSGEDYFNANSMHKENLFILDINLAGMNGINIAKRLRAEHYMGEIIFLTSYQEYVFDGYQVHALNYLLKPIDIKQITPCLDEISVSLKKLYYIFQSKYETIKIAYRDILSISSSLHNIDILTCTEVYSQYATLHSVLDVLPEEFVRVHRSYVVNMIHIHKICGNNITLSNHVTVPIGRQYLNHVRESFAKHSTRLD